MTPTQQLIAKLRECETTMTKGPWALHKMAHVTVASPTEECIAQCGSKVRNFDYEALLAEQKANGHGIATLKNANPTVIAMLERAIGALEYITQCCIGPKEVRCATTALAALDALAREALKEKTDGK